MRKIHEKKGYTQALASLLHQAAPALTVRVIELASDLAGTVMLNQLEGDVPASMLYIITFMALLRGVPSVCLAIAGNFAAKESKPIKDVSYAPESVGKIFRTGMLLTPLLATPFIGMGLSVGPLVKLVHQDSSIASIVQQYFFGYTAALIPSLWVTLNNALLNGIGKGWAIVGFTLLNRGVVLGVTAALLFWLKLGVVSLAIGYGAGAIVALFAMFIYQRCSQSFKPFELFQLSFAEFWQHASNILDAGLAKSGYALAELGSKVYLSFIIGLLGEQALRASQSAFQYSGFITNLVFAFAGGASYSVSREISGDKNYAFKIGNVTIVSSLIVVAFLFLMSVAIGPFMNYPFYGHNGYFSTPHILLMISLFSQLFDTVRNTCAAGGATGLVPKLGASMTRVPMLYNYLGIFFCILPLAFLLSQKTPLAEAGAFVAQGASMALSGFLMAHFWHRMQGQADRIKGEEKILFISALFRGCMPECTSSENDDYSEKMSLLGGELKKGVMAN